MTDFEQALRQLEEMRCDKEAQRSRIQEELRDLEVTIGALKRLSFGNGSAGEVVTRVAMRGRQTKRSSDRPSVHKRAGHFAEIEYGGRVFRDTSDFLDSVGEPHYFSIRWRQPHSDPDTGRPCAGIATKTKKHGHGDESQRQIVRWASLHPQQASAVLLARADGSKVLLGDFLRQRNWL